MEQPAILFDFDFTLTDPTGWLLPAWSQALRGIDRPMPADSIILELVGKPLEKQYAMVTGQPAAGRQYHNFHKIYADYRDAHAVADTSVLPAVRESLSALYDSQFRLAVVSTGAASRLEAVLAAHNLRRYIEMVEAGARDKADGIRRVMSGLGVPSSRTAYVGDHPDDAGAAREAGVLFFGSCNRGASKGRFWIGHGAGLALRASRGARP